MGFFSSVAQYKWVILFYLIIILFIIIKRKKFQFQAKFIALYRTKIGLRIINKIGTKYKRLIRTMGYFGIIIGYIGMAVIIVFIIKGIHDFIFIPEAPPPIAPVLPGVPVPGSPVFVPFWYGIISLFIVVCIHEFSHGIVAKAHGLNVKNTGIVFFGPLIGAFVEPDEKKLKKKKDAVKCSVFSAGPLSNILTAGAVILIFAFIANPIAAAYVHPVGVSFLEVEPGMPAEQAGLKTGVVYTRINNMTVTSVKDFIRAFENISVNETIIIGNDEENHTVTTTSRPENPDQPVIGVTVETRLSNEDNMLVKVFIWLVGLLNWVFILSIGLGLANLLPLGIVDGGRMLQVSLTRSFGEKKGNNIMAKVTIILLIIILVLLWPIIEATLSALINGVSSLI